MLIESNSSNKKNNSSSNSNSNSNNNHKSTNSNNNNSSTRRLPASPRGERLSPPACLMLIHLSICLSICLLNYIFD